ncbi:MAG: T9SS type A sorting domain-containing protein [Bacteroidota bacterium]|nr:T9SS type A sorting domain-containing protein [Bacteroidota bacterium]
MKKKLILIAFLISLFASSQTTFRKSTSSWLTIPNLGNTLTYQNASLIYNNRYYHVWNDYVVSFPGLIVGKYDMNGNLLLPNLARDIYATNKPYKIIPSGNHVSIISENGVSVYMVRRDTTNMNITLSHAFFYGSNWLKINDAMVLQNGNALIVGGVVLSPGSDTLGFFLRVNPANNSVIAQGTVAVNTSTNTQLLSATELNNGNLYITGKTGVTSFIGKMNTNITNPQIIAARLFNQANGKIRLFNASKLICFNSKTFTKIDTNLTLLPAANSFNINSIGQSRSFYMNNRMYSVGIYRNELSIIDSNLVTVTSNTFSMPGTFFEPDLATIGNGIFISSLDTAYSVYVNPSNFHRKVNILKLKNNGLSSCSSPLNYTLSNVSVSTPTLITVNSGTFVNLTSFTINPNGVPNTISHSLTCSSSPPPAPVNTTPPPNQNICNNNSTVLTATASATVNWYSSASSMVVLFTGNSFTTPILSTGNYTFYAESINIDTSLTRTPITVSVSICSGINQHISTNSNELNVFPNPTQSKIKIVSNNQKDKVLLLNSIGEVIMIKEMIKGIVEIEMDLTELSNGFYIIKQGHLTHKILKQ